MRRLIGLLFLIRAFAPLLLVIICLWAAQQMLADLQTALRPSIRVINAEVATIQATAAEAQAQYAELAAAVETAVSAFEAFSLPQLSLNLPANFSLPSLNLPDVNLRVPSSVSVQFTSISGTINRAVDDCSNIPIIGLLCDGIKIITEQVNVSYPSGITVGTSNFRINMPTLPSLTVPLPNVLNTMVTSINGLFSGLTGVFDGFEPALASFTRLGAATQELADTFGGVIAAAEDISAAIQSILLRYGGLLLLAGIMVGLLLVLIYTSSFLNNLLRGWALLTGPTPQSIPREDI